MDRLLSGDIPPVGRCDIKTLAREARVSLAALYRTCLHLKVEFDQRMKRLRDNNHQPDPREAQITRLKDENVRLKTRLSELTPQVVQLKSDQASAISQLAAQHEELLRLGHHTADRTKVLTMPTKTTPCRPSHSQSSIRDICRRAPVEPSAGQHAGSRRHGHL
jgi:predicted nuclease with TOPRIM domain